MSRAKSIIEDHFKDDKLVTQGLLDLCFVLEGFEKITKGSASEEHVTDTLLTAVFMQSNSAFLATMLPVLRLAFVEALHNSDPVASFLKRAVPLVKTLLNGNTIRDYRDVANNVERAFK